MNKRLKPYPTQLFSQSDPSPQLGPSGIVAGRVLPHPCVSQKELAQGRHTGRGGATARWEKRIHHPGGPSANPAQATSGSQALGRTTHLRGVWTTGRSPGWPRGSSPGRGLQLFQMQQTKLLASPPKLLLPLNSSSPWLSPAPARNLRSSWVSSLFASQPMAPKTSQ